MFWFESRCSEYNVGVPVVRFRAGKVVGDVSLARTKEADGGS